MTDPFAQPARAANEHADQQAARQRGTPAKRPQPVQPLAIAAPFEGHAAAPESPVNILLVDDQPENLVALDAVLEPLGQRLVRASSGEDALRQLLHEEFAVILLDIRMPGIDGFETARYIGARQRTRHTPIIFLTGHDADVDHVLRGYEAGAVDYVVKPFDPDVLRSKVSVFVKLHRERRERIRETQARAEAEAIAATVRKLQSLSDAALAHLEMEDLLPELLERTAVLFDADTAGLLLVDETGQVMTLRATHGLEPLHPDAVLAAGEGFLGGLLGQPEPVLLDPVDADAALHPTLAGTGVLSLLGAPLSYAGQPLGVLYLGSLATGHFSSDDAALIALGAERASIAVDHARSYERERSLVEMLQHSLLPERLPQVPQLQMAARYRPSGDAAKVGGDWYDAIVLPDGRVGLAIGDVVGHGVRAATIMGELRNALRAYLMEGHSAGQAMERLNALAAATHDGAMVATLAFLLLDPRTGSASLVNAGHLPPLLLGNDGGAVFLERKASPPLGVTQSRAYEEHTLRFEAGSTLVFYTDGLVERRGESLDVGLDELRESVRDAPADLEELSTHILSRFQGDQVSTDDVAVLVVRLMATADGRLTLRLPAERRSVAVARHAMADLLVGAGASADDISALKVAVSEVCANAVEHAYGPGDYEFDLEAHLDEHKVVVVVRDTGRWRAPRGNARTPGGDVRGNGLKLAEALADSLEIHKADTGTVVRITKRLERSGPGRALPGTIVQSPANGGPQRR